jgi:ribose transport system substrate-binding protein
MLDSRRRILLGLPALLLGCGRQATSSGKPRVALVMKSLANEFFRDMERGALAHQAAHAADYELLTCGIKNETDLAEQVSLVEQMLARRVQALVIAPADSKALIPVLRQAQQAGVAVVNIDNALDADAMSKAGVSIPFVGPDNKAAAMRVAQALCAKLKTGDEVAIIEGVPTAFNSQQRVDGFRQAFAQAGMKLVSSQSGQWEMEKANALAASLLAAHPKLRAIACANDSMALGAAAAIEAAGRRGAVLLVGFDFIPAIQPLLKDGRLLATADQHAPELASFGIEAALGLLAGKPLATSQSTPVALMLHEPKP